MSPRARSCPIAGYAADVGFPDLAPCRSPTRGGRAGSPTPTSRSASSRYRRRRAAGAVPARRAGAGRRRLAGARLRAAARLRARAVRARARRVGASAAGARPAATGHRVYGVGLGGDPTGLALEFFDAVEAMEHRARGRAHRVLARADGDQPAYGPALAAADAAQLVKEMTREVAARRGYRATYLGRPDAMSVGSGLHVNISLRAGVRRGQRAATTRPAPTG